MLWRDPIALVALVLVPLLVAVLVWAERRRRRALDAFVAAGLQDVVVPDVDPRRRRLREALVVAAVGCLVLALAGPRWGFEWEEVRRQGIDLVIALDTSRSMLATDVKPDRLARAKLGVRDVVAEARGDRLALVAFAGTAFLQCPLTLDHPAFVQTLDAVEVGLIPRGGTNLHAAITTALDAFDGREGKHQALVLITDGEKTEGDVAAAIAAAKERGVKIFTVGIGTPDGELIPGEGGGFVKDRKGQVVKSRLDEKTLQEIAVETGGVYLRAEGPTLGLTDLYRDHLATLDTRALGSTLQRRFEHRFQWPLAVALVLLLVEPLIRERRAPARARRRLVWRRAAAAVVLAAVSVGWLDPDAAGREGNRLYAEGRYDEASQQYNQGLLDAPDSARLHFNLGAARYKEGKWDEALAALEQVAADDGEPARTAAVAYNLGNVKFRQGQAVEASEAQKALQLWAEALVAYRRALGANPDDQDAKFNHELVERKIAELRKKLEEQRQQQEQGGEQQQDGQPKEDREQQDGEQPPQKQPDAGEQPPQPAPQEPSQDAPQDEQQPGAAQPAETPPDDGDGQDRAAGAADGERREGEMTRQEAAALLDAQREQEVQPGEIVRRLQGAVVGEPAQDW